MSSIPLVRLGSEGPRVSALGLGCMAMSDMYGPSDRAESIATVHAALDAGVNLIDTGDFYGMGHNEMLLREALSDRRRDSYLLSVKFGSLRDPSGRFLGFDGRPAAVKTFLSYSLKRLGVEYIDIYRPARLDSNVRIEDTIGAIAELIQEGYVRYAGLSEVGANTIRRARKVLPIADLQMEYSLISRGIEAEILPTCRELGIGITAYGVLSRGLISGHFTAPSGAQDFRASSPRFQGENLANNLKMVERLRALAQEMGVSPAQLAIAWVAAQGTDIVPLVGARSRNRLTESLATSELRLSERQSRALAEAIPDDQVTGARYPEAMMAQLDSEKRAAQNIDPSERRPSR